MTEETLAERARNTDDAGRYAIAKKLLLEAHDAFMALEPSRAALYQSVSGHTDGHQINNMAAILKRKPDAIAKVRTLTERIDPSAADAERALTERIEYMAFLCNNVEQGMLHIIQAAGENLAIADRIDLVEEADNTRLEYLGIKKFLQRSKDVLENNLDTRTHRQRKNTLKKQFVEFTGLYRQLLEAQDTLSDTMLENIEIIEDTDERKEVETIFRGVKRAIGNYQGKLQGMHNTFSAQIDDIQTPSEMEASENAIQATFSFFKSDMIQTRKEMDNLLKIDDSAPLKNYNSIAQAAAKLRDLTTKLEEFELDLALNQEMRDLF